MGLWPRGYGKRNRSRGKTQVPVVGRHFVDILEKNAPYNESRKPLRSSRCITSLPRIPDPGRLPFLKQTSPQSCNTTVSSDLLTLIFPLYSINPSFLNLFKKKFTRERVVPTMLRR